MIALLTAALFTLQNEELVEASKKSAALENYTFKLETKLSKGKNQPGAVEGKYQKDQPTSLKTGSTEAFRKGGQIVYKEGEEWKKLEKAAKGEKKSQPAAAEFGLP